jgi:hypothetical protein
MINSIEYKLPLWLLCYVVCSTAVEHKMESETQDQQCPGYTDGNSNGDGLLVDLLLDLEKTGVLWLSDSHVPEHPEVLGNTHS